MEYRVEKDLLGELKIHDDLLYGVHTMRAIENFQISNLKISDYPFFIKGLVVTKKACALANKEIGTIPMDKADMIIEACDTILDNLDHYCQYFPTDVFQGGAGTSVNMNTNEVIANVALTNNGHKKGDYHILNPNDHVNGLLKVTDVHGK